MKNPGKFSLKYMSNPIKSRQCNKENRDVNGTFEECQLDLHVAVTPQKLHNNNQKYHMGAKQRKDRKQEKMLLQSMVSENEKQKKEMKLMKEQIKKLKEKNNEQIETICNYEEYIGEMKEEQQVQKYEKDRYEDNLKYSILWFVEAFSIHTHKKYKLLNDKFIDYFQRLKPLVRQLQIQKQLHSVYEENKKQEEQYLFIENSYSKVQKIEENVQQSQENQQESQQQQQQQLQIPQPQLHTLLDTFNIQEEQEQINNSYECDKIARKLFSGSQTVQHSKQQSPTHKNTHPIKIDDEQLKNMQIQAVEDYDADNEDYLKISKGDMVKLLRKIGSGLWIAESGNTIGYINTKILNI